MADQRLEVSGPVEIEDSSREAVAFRLMQRIASFEATEENRKNREYWLTLYRQCWKAARGRSLADILTID